MSNNTMIKRSAIKRSIAVLLAAACLMSFTGCSAESLSTIANAVIDAAQEANESSGTATSTGFSTGTASDSDMGSSSQADISSAAIGDTAPVHVDRYPLIPEENVKDELDSIINRAIGVVNDHEDDTSLIVYDYEAQPSKYDTLNEYAKYAYDVMYEASSTFTPCTISEADLGSNPFSAYATALDVFREDHPELLLCFDMDTLSRTYKSVFSEANKGINCPSDDMDAVRAGYDKYIETFERIIAGIPEGMSNYEKCMYLTSVIAALTTYNHDKSAMFDPFQAYNALVAGKSICQGYSQAFMLLAHAAGINCSEMETASGDHVWDVLETSQGTRYIDVTWIDGDCEDYNWDFSMTYFLMTEEDLSVYGYIE